MGHITARVSHGASTSGDWREPWDVHQTPRANNWLLPTFKINQNGIPKTGAPEWDKWDQRILKTTLHRPNSSESKVFSRVHTSDGWAALQALFVIISGLLEESGQLKLKFPGQAPKSLWPPFTVNLPDNNICWTIRHWKRALLAAVTQENNWTNELKQISTVSISSLMSYFINPAGANQISSFHSEELPRNWRPEADGDKSSPESGVCLRLRKTRTDLSPSYLSCLDDSLSFAASRWPFVSDDLLILFSPPLPWLFISLLVTVVLPSSSPGEKEERTATSSRESEKKKSTTDKAMDGEMGFHFGGSDLFSPFTCQYWLLHLQPMVVPPQPFL